MLSIPMNQTTFPPFGTNTIKRGKPVKAEH